MSDEHVSADAAGGGDDTESGGRTAVVTRPQRPSGKRSRQRVDDDNDAEATSSVAVDVADDGVASKTKDKPGKRAKKAGAKKKPAGPNVFVFVLTYLKQVVGELRKVIWPNRKQMMTYTSVVLVFLAFMVALVGLADLGLAKLVMLVFGSH